MDKNLISINVDESEREIIKNPGWEKYHSMPVVDYQGKFLGVILYSTLKKMEKRFEKALNSEEMLLTGSDLGELYSLGISAFFSGK